MIKQFVGKADKPTKIKARLLTLNHLTAETIEITQNTLIIGKSEECDFQIDDSNVSANHLQIKFQNKDIILTDLSVHGTYINDQKIGNGRSVAIQNNDQIYLMPYSEVKNRDHAIGFLFKISENQNKYNTAKKLNSGKKIQAYITPKPEQIDDQISSLSEISEKQSSRGKFYDWLEDDIQCTICRECLLEAVAINPCNHYFCGACLSNWLKQNSKKCPTCRHEMEGVMKAHTMNNIIEKYLDYHSDKVRSQEIIDQMKKENLIYQNPEKYLKLNQLQSLRRQFQLVNLEDSSDEENNENEAHESPEASEDDDEDEESEDAPVVINQENGNQQNANDVLEEIMVMTNVMRLNGLVDILGFLADVIAIRRMMQ